MFNSVPVAFTRKVSLARYKISGSHLRFTRTEDLSVRFLLTQNLLLRPSDFLSLVKHLVLLFG